ncbi:MAG: NAD(P)/FAD-dependent oxidoreductase [Thermomicrobiales bacterium]
MRWQQAAWGALGGVSVLGLGGLALVRREQTAHARPRQSTPDARRVVILGAGFAGLTAARTLARQIDGLPVSITLVDRDNYHLFTPLLYQVAACGVDPWDTAQPVRQVVHAWGVDFRQSTVRGVDLAARQVTLDDGVLPYDYLLLGLGSSTNFFGEESAQRHALPLKTLPEALAIRERVVGAFERAATLPDGDERPRLLTFVVIGGGATGTELTASLADLIYHVLPPQYPHLNFDRVRLVMVESEDRPIATMAASLGQAALDRLRAAGVDVRLKTKAQAVDDQSVTTDDGVTIPTATAIWATGVAANDVIARLPGQHGKGHMITVDEYLRLPDHPEVYAAGDNAAYTPPGQQRPAPLLAWVANQEGNTAAENIARALRGEAPQPFQLHELGSAVSLGRTQGAAQFGKITLEGFAGWLAWRAIHLAKISTFRNKAGVALDWTYAYFYRRDTARLATA